MDRIFKSLVVFLGVISQCAWSQDALTIVSSGDIGIGTETPSKKLTVKGSDASLRADNTTMFQLENESTTVGTRVLFNLINNGGVRFDMLDNDTGNNWVFQNQFGTFDITLAGTGTREFRFNSNGNLEISGTLSQSSSREVKHGFEKISPRTVLDRITELPIMKWSYNREKGVAHIGPTSEDFFDLFGLGSSEKSIATVDASGVAFAAIQGLKSEKDEQIISLSEKNKALNLEISRLKTELDQVSAEQKGLERRLLELERVLSGQ